MKNHLIGLITRAQTYMRSRFGHFLNDEELFGMWSITLERIEELAALDPAFGVEQFVADTIPGMLLAHWKVKYTETIRIPIKAILRKCKKMGVYDGLLSELENHTWELVCEWFKTGEVRSRPTSVRKDGISLTRGVRIEDVRSCDCETPDCKCPCTCGFRNPKTGKGCKCAPSLQKWLYKLASASAEDWRYQHAPKSNPASLDELITQPSVSIIDPDGDMDAMEREDLEAQRIESFLEEYGELPEPAKGELSFEDVLRNDLAPFKTEPSGWKQYDPVPLKAPKTMWQTAPSLCAGKAAARFMFKHASEPTAASRAIVEGWKQKLAVPIIHPSQAEWDEWTKIKPVFTGRLDDLSGYIPQETASDAWGRDSQTQVQTKGPKLANSAKPSEWRVHPIHGRVKFIRTLSNGLTAWVTVNDKWVEVAIADLAMAKLKKVEQKVAA